jgi:hypothetical protein
MNASSWGIEWNSALLPDETCSTRPAATLAERFVWSENLTTKAREYVPRVIGSELLENTINLQVS